MPDCKLYREQISLYIDGLIDDEAGLLKHIKGCPGCGRELEDMKLIKQMLNEMPLLPPPECLHGKIMESVNGHSTHKNLISVFSKYTYAAAGFIITLITLSTMTMGINGILNSGDSIKGDALATGVTPWVFTAEGDSMNGNAVYIDDVNEELAHMENSMDDYAEPGAIEPREPSQEPMIAGDTAAYAGPIVEQRAFAKSELDIDYSQAYVKNYNVVIETSDFDSALANISLSEGYTVSQSINDYTDGRNAVIYKQVANNNFDTVIALLKETGTVLSESENRVMLSKQIDAISAQSNLSAKQNEYYRLLGMLEKTGNVNELIMLDERISTVINDIDYYKNMLYGTIRDSENANINITLLERTTLTATSSKMLIERMGGAFAKSVKAIAGFTENMIVFAVSIFPLIAVIAVAFTVIRLKRRA